WPRRPRQKVDREQGKPSTTIWRRIDGAAAPGCARLELEPLTGRTHQLRVHLAAIGHPIAGDALYAEAEALAAAPRLLLHAWRLGLRHPFSELALEFESAPDF
ncbi:MAG: RNA pseudouridine synthase, partial [Burkholderiales bacterium]|nr:RNA pseudouridine synthase [Burkholderiales bacterium]